MSCTQCKICKSTQPCGCKDTPFTIPVNYINDPTICPDPNPCSEMFDSSCICYTGELLICAGQVWTIPVGTNVQTVIQTLFNALCEVATVASTNLYVIDGTLTSDRGLSGANFDLSLGTIISKLSDVNVWSSTTIDLNADGLTSVNGDVKLDGSVLRTGLVQTTSPHVLPGIAGVSVWTITIDAATNTSTLPNGTIGQMLTIMVEAETTPGTMEITPTTFAHPGLTKIELATPGHSVNLLYTVLGWTVIGGYSYVLA